MQDNLHFFISMESKNKDMLTFQFDTACEPKLLYKHNACGFSKKEEIKPIC